MKTLLTALMFFALQASAQTDYYIVPQANVAGWLPLMEQSLGHANISIRCNIAQDECLMKFTSALAPVGAGPAYTPEDLRPILQTAVWDTTTPEPISGKIRTKLARDYGQVVIDDLFGQMDAAVQSGALNIAQLEATLNQYNDFLNLLERGYFGLILYKHSQVPIVGNGVLTTAQINGILGLITQWENDHPR